MRQSFIIVLDFEAISTHVLPFNDTDDPEEVLAEALDNVGKSINDVQWMVTENPTIEYGWNSLKRGGV